MAIENLDEMLQKAFDESTKIYQERGFQRRGGGEGVSHEGGARGVLAIEPLFHAGLLEREGIALGVDAPQRLSGVLLGEPEEALGQ